MRTSCTLYDINTITYTPEWNKPNPLKFSIGNSVKIGNDKSGKSGIIKSCLPAPKTSNIRCRSHCYNVLLTNGDECLFSEDQITLL